MPLSRSAYILPRGRFYRMRLLLLYLLSHAKPHTTHTILFVSIGGDSFDSFSDSLRPDRPHGVLLQMVEVRQESGIRSRLQQGSLLRVL